MKNGGKPKYSANWRNKVLRLIDFAAKYYWFMTDSGCILNDPDPNNDKIDPDYNHEGLMVFAANERRLSHDLPALLGGEWGKAGLELGFTADEVCVILTTTGIDTEHYAKESREIIGGQLLQKYYNQWLRDKLEEALFEE